MFVLSIQIDEQSLEESNKALKGNYFDAIKKLGIKVFGRCLVLKYRPNQSIKNNQRLQLVRNQNADPLLQSKVYKSQNQKINQYPRKGAFEIYVNNQEIFSKLKTKNNPDLKQLEAILLKSKESFSTLKAKSTVKYSSSVFLRKNKKNVDQMNNFRNKINLNHQVVRIRKRYRKDHEFNLSFSKDQVADFFITKKQFKIKTQKPKQQNCSQILNRQKYQNLLQQTGITFKKSNKLSKNKYVVQQQKTDSIKENIQKPTHSLQNIYPLSLCQNQFNDFLQDKSQGQFQQRYHQDEREGQKEICSIKYGMQKSVFIPWNDRKENYIFKPKVYNQKQQDNQFQPWVKPTVLQTNSSNSCFQKDANFSMKDEFAATTDNYHSHQHCDKPLMNIQTIKINESKFDITLNNSHSNDVQKEKQQIFDQVQNKEQYFDQFQCDEDGLQALPMIINQNSTLKQKQFDTFKQYESFPQLSEHSNKKIYEKQKIKIENEEVNNYLIHFEKDIMDSFGRLQNNLSSNRNQQTTRRSNQSNFSESIMMINTVNSHVGYQNIKPNQNAQNNKVCINEYYQIVLTNVGQTNNNFLQFSQMNIFKNDQLQINDLRMIKLDKEDEKNSLNKFVDEYIQTISKSITQQFVFHDRKSYTLNDMPSMIKIVSIDENKSQKQIKQNQINQNFDKKNQTVKRIQNIQIESNQINDQVEQNKSQFFDLGLYCDQFINNFQEEICAKLMQDQKQNTLNMIKKQLDWYFQSFYNNIGCLEQRLAINIKQNTFLNIPNQSLTQQNTYDLWEAFATQDSQNLYFYLYKKDLMNEKEQIMNWRADYQIEQRQFQLN